MPARRHAPSHHPTPDHPLTRRSALALGAAAGLGALVRAPEAGWAASSAATRSFSLGVGGDAWARGGGRLTGVLQAPRRFDLLGLKGRGLADARVEVRVRRRGGAWSPWTRFGVGLDHAPDRPRSSAIPTDPVWAGGADELQLRARRAPGGLRVHFVGLPTGAARPRTPAFRPRQAGDGGPPPIVPRAQWGGDQVTPRSGPSVGEVQLAFVHHTVSANQYAPEDSAGIVLAIAKYHRDTNGWNDIGYNLLVDQYGQVFEGRAGGVDLAVVGAQAQGWNAKSTGIAAIGTFSDVPFPEAGLQALARTIAYKLTLHGVPTVGQVTVESAGGAQNRYRAGVLVTFDRISGHRDGCSTSCPGDALFGQLDDVRARAAKLAGTVVATPKLTAAPVVAAVAYGEVAAFAGGLTQGDGQPLANVPIVVQKQGSKGWATVARTSSGADGAWSVALAWKRAAAVRAVAQVPGRTAPVRSTPVTVGLTPVLKPDALAPRVQAGRAMTVAGQVRPSGRVVARLEREVRPGVFRKVADVPLAVRGARYSGRVPFRKPGLHRLTVMTAGAAAPVVAPSVTVRAVRRAQDVRPAAKRPASSPGAAAGGAGAN